MSEQEYTWEIYYKEEGSDEIQIAEERGKTEEEAISNLFDVLSKELDKDATIIGIKCLGKAVSTGKHFLKISELI